MTDLTDESVKALLDGATPGAWAVNPKAATNVEAGRRGVAACGGYFDNTSDGAYAVENEANAHLIAAAPDLARALLDARAELAQARAEAQAAVARGMELAAEILAVRADVLLVDAGADAELVRVLDASVAAIRTAAVKALRVEARENAMQALASMGQAQEAYEAQLKAEAERDRIAAELATSRARETALVEALVEQNELLRSAMQIAKREGVDGNVASTNWDAYYNRVAVSLKRHHDTVNQARATLAQTPTDPGDGWTWNERLGWIGPDGKPADPRRRG